MDDLSQEHRHELKSLFDGLSKAAADKVQDAGDRNDESSQFGALQTRIDEMLGDVAVGSGAFYRLLVMKNSILYEEAKMRMLREDTAVCEELLERTLKNIYEYREHPQVVFLHLRIVNHLAYILSKKGELQKAQELLEEVSKPIDASWDDKKILVYSTEELFANIEVDQSQAHNKLGKLMANNLQMLGWVYGKMGNYEMYTLKLHEALQQLLRTTDNDLVHWACRCIRLALLYLNRCQYVPARYHLAASGTVLDNLEVSLSPHPELGKAQADLARCWIHYGLHLFGTSKTYILEKMCSEDIFSLVTLESDPPVPEEKLDPKLVFDGLDVVPQPVPATMIKTTDQARSLFAFTQIWLKRVRVYYTIRDYPILYVNAILNQSELNRYMAFYEPDLDSQYKVQKMRADSLEQLSGILKEVRPKCYIAISVELLRELAEVQIELMSINLRKLYSQGQANTESEIRRRIHAVSDIHSKLEGVGDMMGHSNLVEQDLMQGSQTVLNEEHTEEVETTDSVENAASENSEEP